MEQITLQQIRFVVVPFKSLSVKIPCYDFRLTSSRVLNRSAQNLLTLSMCIGGWSQQLYMWILFTFVLINPSPDAQLFPERLALRKPIVLLGRLIIDWLPRCLSRGWFARIGFERLFASTSSSICVEDSR